MKLISLNIWHGARLDGLIDFIKKEAPTTDVFAFQEVDEPAKNERVEAPGGLFNNISLPRVYSAITDAIPDFVSYKSAPYISIGTFLALFVKNTLKVDGLKRFRLTKTIRVFDTEVESRLLCARISGNNNPVWICNTHGILVQDKWREDTTERIIQSKMTIKALSHLDGPKILCGDFNMPPGTETMRILGRKMENLVVKFDVKNTRSKSYLEQASYSNGSEITDHILISNGISVKNFEVMDADISDHLPLLLDFNVDAGT